MRRRILIALAVVFGIALLTLLVGVLYLFHGDLSGYRSTVERLVSDELGRELRIAGDFKPDVGFTSHLEASEITLANPEWSSEPYMVSVDSLTVEIRLLPVLFGSFEVGNVEVKGARVVLESDDDGRANWQFDIFEDDEAEEVTEPPEIRIGSVNLENVELVYRGPSLDRPLELTVAKLGVESDDTGMLDLSLDGALNEASLGLSGRLGTLGELLAAGEVEHELAGNLGSVKMVSRGRIGQLETLADADLDLEIDGAEMSEITTLLGLPFLGDGPFRLVAATSPTGGEYSISLDGTFGQVTVGATGVTDALLEPATLDLEVRASGPEFSAVAALAGIEGAAAKPFSVSGHVRWDGFPLALDDVTASIGDNRVTLDGILGAPPRMLDTDFRFDAEGPDLSAIALLGGFNLPAESFRVHGRLVRLEAGIGIESVEANVGPTVARVDGTLGDPPEFAGTDLQVEAHGPDLGAFSDLAGAELPELPFEVAGRLVPVGDAVTLEGVTARLGPNTARVDGTVAAVPGFMGTDLRLVAEGPDLSWLERPTGLGDLPREPYRVEGGVVVETDGYRLDGMNARVGAVTARLDGRVGSLPDLAGTSVRFLAEGPDFSIPAALAGAPGVPPEPFRIEGGLQAVDGDFHLEGVQARVGEARATVTGRIAPSPDLIGTEVSIDARGQDASIFGPLLGRPSIPAVPFSVSGALRISPAGYGLETVVVELAGNRAEIDGTVVPSESFAGTDVRLAFSTPDLDDVGQLISRSGLVELPELPREPFSLTGGATVEDDGYSFKSIEASLGTATARLDGRVGLPPEFHDADLTIHADGPNASLFTALTGVTVPVAPFQIDGRVERLEDGYRFHDLTIRLGEYRARADGRLGEPPALIGTDLDVGAEGPSLMLLSDLSGIPDLPDLPFEVAGRFDGNPTRFKAEEFAASLGASDVSGTFRIELEGKPRVQANLTSERVDLEQLMPQRGAEEGAAADVEPQAPETDGFVISDEPFQLGILQRADGETVWNIGELILPLDRFSEVQLDVRLEDGRLEAGPLEITGSGGGTIHAGFVLEPTGEDYTLRSKLNVAGARLSLTPGEADRSQRPKLDVDLELGGIGSSPHEIASTASGRVQVVAGEGALDTSLVDLVAADIVVTLLQALNPLSKEKPASSLGCAVVVMNIENGVAVMDPMAVQTDVMTVLGGGKIDFSTEELDFDWVTKPRKGLGISAGMITNPYIKLGGTLGKPSVEMKPLQAMTSTGVAVATGGVSLLARGLFDRVTAEKKVCEQALKKVEKRRRKAEEGGN